MFRNSPRAITQMDNKDSLPESKPHIYYPAGAEALLQDSQLSSAAAKDLISRVGRRSSGVAINASEAQGRYGRPGTKFGPRAPLYNTVRDTLITTGVIEPAGSYVVGARSKRYRLTASWQGRRRVRAPAVFRDDGERKEGARPVPAYLRYCAESATYDLAAAHLYLLADVGVDPARARELVDACAFPAGDSAGFNAIGEEIERVATARYADLPEGMRDGAVKGLISVANERVMSLWRWRCDHDFWAHRDPSGYRLHTPITNLAHELRPFLGFSPALSTETELWEIDATNSQPLLLATLAVRKLGTDDAKDLARICAEGHFYEETYCAVHGALPTPAERERWKPHLMATWLYGPVTAMNGKEGKALKEKWPTVHAWIRKRKIEEGERALPCAMQEEESKLWIDTLGPELERLHIPVFTVHDAAIVPASKVDATIAAVRSIYAAAGIEVRLSAKRLTLEPPGFLERARAWSERDKAARAATAKRKAARIAKAKLRAASPAPPTVEWGPPSPCE